MRSRFTDKVVVITGAGRGIGLEAAKRFAREGAYVCFNDLDAETVEGARQEIDAEAGPQSYGVICDVTVCADVRGFLSQIKSTHGRIDVLVNNAGILLRSDFRNMPEEDWKKVMASNVEGTVNFCRDSFALLREAENSSIVNMTSIAAGKHLRQLSSYATAKGAIKSLTTALAIEYASYGIRVNSVSPGFIDTKMISRFTSRSYFRDFLLKQTPLRRFGTPEEVAHAILFLASSEAAYITGSQINVDGGASVTL
jgi:NAD(P)-dependent dehydrogenase (short-subunit alcohol dehydrogenase family)